MLDEEKAIEGYYQLPEKWSLVGNNFINQVKSGNLEHTLGLDPASSALRLYHGTGRDKLPFILKDHGMKAFFEKDNSDPSIFVTASPINALQHIIEYGPHDTLRKEGKLNETHEKGNEVLLTIEVPKEWLADNEEANIVRKSKLPSYIRQAKGYPDTYKNIDHFMDAIHQDAENVKSGKGADSFGIRFPTNFIPEEFIYVIKPDGQKVSITDYLESRT